MTTETFIALLNELKDIYQKMREENNRDMRTVIYLVDCLIDDLKEAEENNT